jgi:hypothetical protein
MENLKTASQAKQKVIPPYSVEVREGAVRRVYEHEAQYTLCGAAISSMAPKIVGTAETLRGGGCQAEGDGGLRVGQTPQVQERIRTLEREHRE